MQVTAAFTATTVNFVSSAFADNNCTALQQKSPYGGTYTIGVPSAVVSGATEYDITMQNTITHSIFAIEHGNRLHVGADDGKGNDGSTAAKRTRVLNPTLIYSRVP